MSVKHFGKNTAGRDFAVGDIHGCFSRLQVKLDSIGFDPYCDRLFSTGDLVDRGPESEQVLSWLDKSWFHAVRGNHEDMAIHHYRHGIDVYAYNANGGAWFIGMTPAERADYALAFADLPVAMEVETESGLVGIVHAECPVTDWSRLELALTGPAKQMYEAWCMWQDQRIKCVCDDDVAGVRAVVVGHYVVERFTSLGNVYYCDTGAYRRGRDFTIIDLATMEPVKAA
ncbi:metallophosphoesterase [Cupriavidus basilensis]|nr:metallophosphoesterase [Cupriavidus basilensis]